MLYGNRSEGQGDKDEYDLNLAVEVLASGRYSQAPLYLTPELPIGTFPSHELETLPNTTNM